MGDAGQAAGGILLLVENPNKVRARSDKWNADHIVGSGSKNIPVLQFAHDLLLADRTNDADSLERAWTALNGYFAYARVHGHMLGEEYSTIYWRWIVVPIWIAGRIAKKRGVLNISQQVDKWLQDFVTVCALASLPELKYFQSEHAKNPGDQLFGMPCAAIMGARSWVYNDGDDNKRDWGDSMSWVDATSHAPWLSWALQKTSVNQLTGGDKWVAKVSRGITKIYGVSPVIDTSVAGVLNEAVYNGVYPAGLVESMEYGPTKPMVVGRMTNGTWCVGERSFTSGSTSFMHCKVLPFGSLSYRVYGVAHPLKRSNKDDATATLSADFKSCELVADDGTVFDWATLKEVEGTLRVPLLDGDPMWVVRIAAGQKPERLDAQSGPDDDQNGDGGWCDWYKRLF
jgi:hypothetical protein